MALPNITASDFTGLFRISQAQLYTEQLNLFVSEKYAPFIRNIVGDPAYIEIKNETPLVKQKWIDLFEGTDYFNNEEDEMRTHRGLKRVALGNVYFYWVRESGIYNTPTGDVQNKNGNSMNVGGYVKAQDRYNTVLSELMNEVYPFIKNYEKVKKTITSSIELGGNVYTINTTDTTYLYDADVVKIDNIEYTISNLVSDTSFDITANKTGLDFSNKLFIYEPYKDFPLPCLYASVI